MRNRTNNLRKTNCRKVPIRQPELLEPRQLLAADPIVVNYDLDSDHFGNDDLAITLREALEIAKANPGHDTITFAPNLKFSTLLPTSELLVDSDVTIDATSAGLLRVGREITDRSNHRIFNVTGNATVVMENIIVQGGSVGEGGFGAGILNNGNLTLINSVVGGNTQTRRDTGTANSPRYLLGGGGGIYNGPSAVLELDNTHVGALTIDTTDFTDLQPDGERGRNFELVARNQAELGSGILNRGKLVVTNGSSIAGNQSNFHGAGIYNTGLATIRDSRVVGNRILNGLGDAHGGGIVTSNRRPSAINPASRVYTYVTQDSLASLTVDRSEIKYNSGGRGGGIFSDAYAQLIVRDTEFEGNSASKEGGGIYSSPRSFVVPLTNIERSLFVANDSRSQGAAIAHTRGESFINVSTFTENTGAAAIYSSADIEVSSSTITRNERQGVVIQTGNLNGSLELYNSVVAENVAGTSKFYSDLSFNFPNTTSYASAGYNLVGSVFTNNGNIQHQATDQLSSANPGLGPLDDFGGHTRSIGLLPNSPALNSGPSTFAARVTDQRGESRIVGPLADRGAFESQPLIRLEVDSLEGIADGYYAPGRVSLSDAVAWANALPGADTITFSDELLKQIAEDPELGGVGQIVLDSQIVVSDDLTILGPGADLLSVSGNGRSRIFVVDSDVTLDLRDITLRDGRSNAGGAIKNSGKLSLTRVEIRDSSAIPDGTPAGTGLGGAIWSGAGTSLTLNAASIVENNATNGGGMYVNGLLDVHNSTLAYNQADGTGGAFWLHGSSPHANIQNATIASNSSGVNGGGFRSEAIVHMGNSVVAGNLSPRDPDYSDGPDLVSEGYNLIGDIGTARSPLRSFNTETGGDILGGGVLGDPVDPLLGPLRRLGGPTRSMGVLPTSPLIDRADPRSVVTVDQRGIGRPFGDRNDIGAFEYVPPEFIPGQPIVVDSLDSLADGYFAPGEMSLAEAILFAEELPGANTITFADDLFGEESGESREIVPDRTLAMSDELTIIGPGAGLLTIGAGVSNPVVRVSENGNASISGLTIDGKKRARVIANAGELWLSEVYVTNGSAKNGAGLLNTGSVIVVQSTFAKHESQTFFGEGTSEKFFGGAIHNAGSFEASNSTISSNTGGGIWNVDDGNIRLQQSTVAYNDLGIGNLGDATIQSTIVAANEADIVNRSSVISQGYNLISALVPESGLLTLKPATDIIHPQPALTELVSISESIPMHGLLPSSPAIDAGAAVGEAVDQRGRTRPTQYAHDIGAFEAKELFWTDELVVTDLSDRLDAEYESGLSLREAVLWANRKDASNLAPGSGDVITFHPELVAEMVATWESNGEATTIELRDYQDPDLIISAPLEISPFRHIDRDTLPDDQLLQVTTNGAHRIVTVLDTANLVSISDLTLFGGGDVQNGGGVYTAADLMLDNVVVRDNSSISRGGGIAVAGDANLWLDHSEISRNKSLNAAGINASANTTVDIAYSSVLSNQTTVTAGRNIGIGGGLYSLGEIVVMSSTFANNEAQTGGAIVSLGTMQMDNTTISGNRARYGGGLLTDNVTVINNSTITDNNTIVDGQTSFGGSQNGKAIRNRGQLLLNNSILFGNTADDGQTSVLFNVYNEGAGANVVPTASIYSERFDDNDDNPMLLPLASNGGPTRTHALNPESPAIDAGDTNFTPILDQRGRPMVDIPTIEGSGEGNVVDIGAYEVQSVVNSDWTYSARSRSQFGEGTATVFGFGFDDGVGGRSVSPKPVFLGIPFDTGPLSLGGIEDVLGAKFGGEVRADFAGRLGFDLGLYVNSGAVDVDYGGMLNYVIDEDPATGVIDVATFFDIEAGSLYTVSPKVGAYMDLVVELDANIGASGCLFGCVGFDIPFKVDEKIEMFAINRQKTNPQGEKYFDGEIRIGGGSLWSPSIGETVGEDELRERQATERLTDANRRIAESENELQRITDEEDALKKATGQGAVQGGTLDQRRNAALNSRSKAQTDKARFENDVRESNPAKNGKRKVGKKQPDIKTGLQVSFAEASGSLLGVQGTLAAVAEVDLANVDPVIEAGFSKEIGSVAVTVPDINLQDRTPDSRGKLSASTSDFEKGSEEEAKRQLAKLQVDAGGLLGPMLGIPAGKYSASLGPLSLSAQLISYNIGPQLNVTQDVDAQWYAKHVSFVLDKPASVSIDDGALELIDEEDSFTFSFRPGQDVKITPIGDEPITVSPSLTMDVKFENDFGLDIDLEGALEALSLKLSVGSQSIIDIKPLITEKHNLGTLDLGSIFKRNWDLLEKVEAMPSFQIGGQAQDGKTAASALMGEVDSANNRLSTVEVDGVDPNTIVFLAKDVVTRDEGNAFFHSDVNYAVNNNQIKSIYVLQDGLSVEAFYENGSSLKLSPHMGRELNLSFGEVPSEYPTGLRVSGFNADTLDESSRVVVALKFANAETPVMVDMTLGDEFTLLPAFAAGDTGNIGSLSQAALDNLVTTAVVGFDVDGDGKQSPLTDGVLLMRYMDQPSKADLRVDAVGKDATRTPQEIWEYIDETLDRIELPDEGGSYRTLDIDGDGNVWSKTDGVLVSRFLAGFNGTVLTAGALGAEATRTNAAELREFLRFGRVTTNDAEVELRDENDDLIVSRGSGFGEVLQFQSTDLFGVDGSLDASGAAPGTASGNAVGGETSAIRGASAESAASPRSSKSNRTNDLKVFEFELPSYRETVEYDEIYLVNDADEELDISTHELVSRVAQGAPANFANTKYESLTTDDVESKLRRNVSTSVLGVDEPIFVQAPDAAGYTYLAVKGESGASDFLFKEVVIDTQVGDNGYLSGGFDLYRQVSVTEGAAVRWEFVAFIEAGNPLFDSGNGILRYEFGKPVETFRLFPTALPSVDIHQEDNLAAPELVTVTGFTLVTTNDTSSVPKIEMMQIAHREAPNDPPIVTLPVHIEAGTTGVAGANHVYQIIRAQDSENAKVTGRRAYDDWGTISQTIQLASANQIRVLGSDSAQDTLNIDFSAGPIHTPIEFDGGSRTDTVRLVGDGVHLDLTQNHQFTNVELFDIGGTGSNSLRVDINVLQSIGSTNNTFTIVGTDAVNDFGVDRAAIGAGWEFVGSRPGPQFTTFDIYQQNDITLEISGGILVDATEPQVPLAPSGQSILNQSVSIIEQPAQASPIVRIVKSKKSTQGRAGDNRSITSLETTFSTSLLAPSESTELTATANLGNSSTGFQFRVHYDSSQVDLQRTPDGSPIINLTSVFADQLSGAQVSSDCLVAEDSEGSQREYCHGVDRDANTDSYVNFLWLDHDGEWPANSEAVAELLTLNFVAQDAFTDSTVVRFTGDLSGGIALTPSSNTLFSENAVDLNGDGNIDSDDIDFLFASIRDGDDDETLDLNKDENVDQGDVDYLLAEVLETRRGDANLDGDVGFADFLLLSANFGQQENGKWQEGDFDGDGEVDFADFLLLSRNFGNA